MATTGLRSKEAITKYSDLVREDRKFCRHFNWFIYPSEICRIINMEEFKVEIRDTRAKQMLLAIATSAIKALHEFKEMDKEINALIEELKEGVFPKFAQGGFVNNSRLGLI